MAIIKCPECSHEISDLATSCPNCGYPMNLKVSSTGNSEFNKQDDQNSSRGKIKLIRMFNPKFKQTIITFSIDGNNKFVLPEGQIHTEELSAGNHILEAKSGELYKNINFTIDPNYDIKCISLKEMDSTSDNWLSIEKTENLINYMPSNNKENSNNNGMNPSLTSNNNSKYTQTYQGTEVFEVLSGYKFTLPNETQREIARIINSLNSQGKTVVNVTTSEPRKKAAILWACTVTILWTT